jgi:hypothetical protein
MNTNDIRLVWRMLGGWQHRRQVSPKKYYDQTPGLSAIFHLLVFYMFHPADSGLIAWARAALNFSNTLCMCRPGIPNRGARRRSKAGPTASP